MAPVKGKASNSGSKNPHLRLVSGKLRFNPNTNVPMDHSGCIIMARSRIDKENYRKFGNPPKVYVSGAKGIFHVW